MKKKAIVENKRPLLTSENRKKHLFKVRLLKYLYEVDAASVGEICKALFISTPTTLKLLNELIKEQWIEKKGFGKSMGGRKPDLFGLRPGSLFSLCIDIELFSVKMVILDNAHKESTPILTKAHTLSKDREEVDQVYQAALALMKESGIDKNRLIGVSIGMPGLVDSFKGENYSYLTSDVPGRTLQQSFEEKFGMPVILQNDVKGTALAELRHGQALGKKNALVLLMDWGVGLGIIMDGKVRQGASGFSGEMGHIPFIDNGDLCYCGKHGCLETVASGLALAKMAKEGILSGKNSILAELSEKEIDNIEAEVVIKAANRGDQYAIKLLSNIGTNMGKGISTLIQLFNPELIILGGKIAEARQYITLPMQQAINTYCMTQIREKASIVSSELGQNGRLLGYATASFDHYFTSLLTTLEN
ncbi:ROK family transcriptional regulator [Niabella beijingensis]|uniref:ROK family transcriptional regulator n=1 Tax=Niabella beijingensis TaxID=2872700 RepID=UPI001CBB0AC2|nr:ROK family transcriptional regulator [Niabella beijingensis]MBZ4189933.1 ROK family protein [Niabella beijingensis]